MPSISVLDAVGATQTVQTLPAVGQAASAASLPTVIASDQPNIPTFGPDVQITGSITTQDIVSATAVGQNGQSIITGTPTAGSALVATSTGNTSFAVQVTGTWTGTLQLERSLDGGVTYTPVSAFTSGTAFTQQTITGNGAFHGNSSASTHIRVRATSAITGTASVRIVLGQGTGTITVAGPNATGSGTLSATDAVVGAPVGDGTLVSGTSTAGSVVALVVPDRMIAWTLLIKGYVSGTIYTEASTNSTNGIDGDWVEVKGRRTGTAPGVESVLYAMVANGYYRGNCAGFKYLRTRLIGGTGPTIRFDLSSGMGATFLNSGIPQGSSSIGTVVLGTGAAAVGTVGVTSLPALVAGAAVIGAVTQSGTWNIGTITTLPALVAGSAIVGKFGIDQTTPGTTNLVSIGTGGTVGLVAGAAVIGAVTQSGTWNIGSITTLPALATGANVIGAVTQSGTWNIGSITTLPALVAGSAIVGKFGIDQTTPGTTNAVVNTPATPTPLNLSSAATTNATSVKATAGTLFGITASNVGAAAAFVKLYNKATAPTVGTDVPVLTIPIAASGVVSINLGETGHRFAAGIALAITNLVADSDATAVAAAQVKVMLDYI